MVVLDMQIIHIFVLSIISQFSDPCNRLSWLRISFLANVRPGLSYTPLQMEVLLLLQRLIGVDLCGQFTAQ